MPKIIDAMKKKVQVRKTIDAIEFKRLTIDRETKIYSCEVKLDPAVEIALIRLELKDYPQLYIRCPVRSVFGDSSGKSGPLAVVGTIVADIPDVEIERLNEKKVKFE